MKKFRVVLMWSTLLIWLPVLIDLLLWNKLPNRIATHYNVQMVPDGWSSKPVAIFMIPLVFTLIQIFMIFLIARDPRSQNVKKWINNVVWGIIPVLSIVLNGLMLFTALGGSPSQIKPIFLNLSIGVIFIIIGTVLKSVSPNRTIGIRLPWTLNSTKNWRLTHQLGSKLFIGGGVIILILGVLGQPILLSIVLVLLIIVIPCIYSFVLYKKGI